MIDTYKDIEKLETDLWEAADNLRANSKLTSSDYFMPVLGVIFLRHAANRFGAARRRPAQGLRHLRDQGPRRPYAPLQQRADQAGHRRRLRPYLRVLPRQV